MLNKRVYEVDPLSCPECGSQMDVVAFIEPPQEDIIESLSTEAGEWASRRLVDRFVAEQSLITGRVGGYPQLDRRRHFESVPEAPVVFDCSFTAQPKAAARSQRLRRR